MAASVYDNYPAERYVDDAIRFSSEECKRCVGGCGYIGMTGEWACHGFKPITNADRIRSMTDEELAAHLERFDCSYPMCPCSLNICTEKGCSDAWIDWLKQEAT